MGMVLGTISEELPKHVVVHQATGYQIWRYTSPSVAAVVYADKLIDPKTNLIPTEERFTSLAFPILARYIGVFSTPENVVSTTTNDDQNEKIAMTAPVVMDPPTEKIAMTAPVVMDPPTEKIAMTAPVVMDPPTEKIAMTAPVVMDPSKTALDQKSSSSSSSSGSTMKFLLPSKYTSVDKAPRPTNPSVVLETIPGGRCEAVYQFNGNFNMVRASEKASEFLKRLEENDKVKVIGPWTAQGYNPPFTLPMMKRNEIHVPVDPTPFEEEAGSTATASSSKDEEEEK